MNVNGVHNGIVLDHIKAGTAMTIYNLLQLDKLNCCVAIIQNVDSKKRNTGLEYKLRQLAES